MNVKVHLGLLVYGISCWCAVQGQFGIPDTTGQTFTCNIGKPLKDSNGTKVFCGRGPNREDCPETHLCKVHPADAGAICCTRGNGTCHEDLQMSSTGLLGATVPSCTIQGQYQPMQCSGSTGMCWCVDEGTGKEIEGTMTSPGEARPQCDEDSVDESTEVKSNEEQVVCPDTQVWNDCGSHCNLTCENPIQPCILMCQPRCECPWQKPLLHDGKCIAQKDCPKNPPEAVTKSTEVKSNEEQATCPGIQIWRECGSLCDKTCDEPNPMCAAVCKPRCQCPLEKPLLEDGECISEEECINSEDTDEDVDGSSETVTSSSMPSFCLLDPEMGPCEAAMNRWFYDSVQGECRTFMYGGCVGNKNNFQNKMSCENMCKPYEEMICPDIQIWKQCGSSCDKTCDEPNPMCMTVCQPRCQCPPEKPLLKDGQCISEEKCIDSEDTDEEVDGSSETVTSSSIPSFCLLEPEMGPCEAAMNRWFYDSVQGECSTFMYGGCDGNQNNFQNKMSCENMCKPYEEMICPDIQIWKQCGSSCDKTCDEPNPKCMAVCQPRCQCPPEKPLLKDGQCISEEKCIDSEDTDEEVDGSSETVTSSSIPSFCLLEPEMGPCEAAMNRWFYDSVQGECSTFMYGGCDGNQNNFQNKMSCENMCKPYEEMICPDIQIWKKCGSPCDKTCDEPNPMCITMCQPRCQCPPEKPLLKDGECISEEECINSEEAVTKSTEVKSNEEQVTCPDIQIWSECGSLCDKTCDEPNPMCAAVCQPRCQCPPEKPLLKDGECISECIDSEEDCETLMCRDECREGYKKDDIGCPSCDCVDPCEDVTCPGNAECMLMERECETTYCPRKPTCMSSTCLEMPDPGPCREREDMWYFDSSLTKCDIFQYGGCSGNLNRFITQQECEFACTPQQDIIACMTLDCNEDVQCLHGFKKDENNCPTCECQEPPKPACTMPICTMYCEYGFVKDDEGCPICKCNDLCQNVTCAEHFNCDVQVLEKCAFEPCETKTICIPEQCTQPKLTGPCRASHPRFYYDTVTDECQPFIYGGCQGNENNFNALAECNGACVEFEQPKPACSPMMCMMHCKHGFKKDENGCDICKCNDLCWNVTCAEHFNCDVQVLEKCAFEPCETKTICIPEQCTQPKLTGPCRASHPRFYYDTVTDECQPFIYGGCQGNENNFNALAECNGACVEFEQPKPACSPMMCMMHCKHGFKKDENGCDICKCNDLCWNITCAQDFVCNVEMTDCTTEPCDVAGVCIPEKCSKPKDTGPCRALFPRYYFNTEEDKCDSFNYGGCQGNDNNFKTEDECKAECVDFGATSLECPPICRMYCQFGFVQDDKGCDICECKEKPKPTCSPMMCMMYCELGFEQDENGCDICECKEEPKPTCSPMMCMMYCELGFEQDENGCDICECKEEPKPTCSPMMCMMYCELGFEQDENGCDICECKEKPKPTCSPMMCMMYCELGFEQDENGCDICECKEEPKPTCSPMMCMMYCDLGFEQDENGCDICECKEKPKPTCSPMMCMMYCELGFEQDENGCDICECKEEPKPTCSPMMCMMYCELGFEQDENGCDICECKEEPKPTCSPMMCMMYCDLGFEQDENGCDICECKEKPKPTCSPMMCMMYCELGFEQDENGCDICECKEEPKPTCSPMMCMMYCDLGFEQDENGCDICECKEEPKPTCSPMMCMMYCELGFEQDENGCDICECKEAPKPTCSPVMCAMYCEHGFEQDDNGCDKCKCKEEPKPTCSPMMCMMYCELGFEQDEKGCDICECKEAPKHTCSPVMCAMYCEHGFEQDDNGCDKCKCKEGPKPTCSPMMCMMYCDLGFEQDENGCDICECKEEPKPTCSPIMCMMYCEHGFEQDDNGCDKCKCKEEPKPTCSPMMCMMFCDLGFEQDENGCDICECKEEPKPTCSPMMCMMYCELGFEQDENGCDICECKEEPKPTCSPMMCMMYCDLGFEQDENGCDICECKEEPKPTCSPMMCMMYCELGFEQDEKGCDICECKEAPKPTCSPVMCAMYCEHGFEQDDNGCDKCKCKEGPKPTCSPMMCMMYCDLGFEQDENGCDICECKEEPKPTCSPMMCMMYCDLGFEQDENGCDICECKEEPKPTCSPMMCMMYCELGFEQDENGCDICECKEKPKPTCSPMMCMMYCEHGFEQDQNGCDLCKCNEPCQNVTCPSNFTCDVQSISCETEACVFNGICIPEKCSKPKDTGPCRALFPRYYFNTEEDKCDNFNYGGCQGNDNNFKTEDECKAACVDFETTCSPVMCAMYCEYGFEQDDNGCDKCKCKEAPKPTCSPVMCAMYCEHGFEQDDNGCDKCKCKEVPKPTCSPVICAMYCEHGFEQDDNGCDKCKCKEEPKPTCSPMMCMMYCDYGFEQDENGCDVCECKEEPKPTCSPMMCMMYCDYGFEQDENGCDICECKEEPKPTCSPMMCLMYCEYGFMKDLNGCDICKCSVPCQNITCASNYVCDVKSTQCETEPCELFGVCMPEMCSMEKKTGPCRARKPKYFFNKVTDQCEVFMYGGCQGNENNFETEDECKAACVDFETTCPPICRMYCEYGFVKNHNGCDICQCQEPPKPTCSPVMCAMYCEHGFEQDENGCDICKCKEEPKPTCSPMMCMMYCDYGFEQDENGCDVCECKEEPKPTCSPMMCMMYCEHGFEQDENGCDICECKEEPKPTCSPMMCLMYCDYGFMKDLNGCDICKCSVPCQNITCASNYVCDVKSTQCETEPCELFGVCMPEICSMEKKTGPCRARKPKYFFNKVTDQCELFMYGGCQGNENNFETEDECKAACVDFETTCPPICRMYCEYGFVKDHNGCDICQCQEPPKPTCAPLICDKTCEQGYKLGSNNCSMCECEWNFCSPDSCQLSCANSGYFIDLGCAHCKCNDPCEEYQCPEGEVCIKEQVQCIRAPCPAMPKCVADIPPPEHCLLPQETGSCRLLQRMWFYNHDDRDCQTFSYSGCGGNKNLFGSRSECIKQCVEFERPKPTCAPVDCPLQCVHGTETVTNDNDCPVCQCLCPLIKCATHCMHGYKKDNDLCRTCKCEAKSCPTCSATDHCKYGHLRDAFGCKVCGSCFEDPCKHSHLCKMGETCIAEEMPCDYATCETDVKIVPECIPDQNLMCMEIMEAGDCTENIPSWFYNTESQACESFTYTGCGGNGNRFVSQEACGQQCMPWSCPKYPTPLPVCAFGYKEDARGCKLSKCRDDPCKSLQCGVNVLTNKVGVCQHVSNCTGNTCQISAVCSDVTNKVGECPSVANHVFSNLCGKTCSDDSTCPSDMKCCDSGCGSMCMPPVTIKVAAQQTTCLRQQKMALLRLKLDPLNPITVPMCNPNDESGTASFQPIQCNLHLGTCWCQDPDTGRKIEGTQVRGMPNCANADPSDHGYDQDYEEPVCPTGEPIQRCNPLLCSRLLCVGHPGAHCRINPCGECTVHFYDNEGKELDYENDCLKGLSKCQSEQTVIYNTTWANVMEQIINSPEISSDFIMYYTALGFEYYEIIMKLHQQRKQDEQREDDKPYSPPDIYIPPISHWPDGINPGQGGDPAPADEEPYQGPLPSQGSRSDIDIPPIDHWPVGIPQPDGSAPISDPLPTNPEAGEEEGEEPLYVPGEPKGPSATHNPQPLPSGGSGSNTDMPEMQMKMQKHNAPHPMLSNSYYIPMCRPLHEHYHGGYEYKQCASQYCWCVDDMGKPRPGTLRNANALLTCTEQGINMQLSFGGTVMCPSGVDPMICTNQCNNAQCLGYPGPLHCIADPCQMCAVQFYNPKWEPIDACKESAPQTCDNSDSSRCRSDWQYNKLTDSCQSSPHDPQCHMTVFETKQHCSFKCKEQTCPHGMKFTSCEDQCRGATCAMFPEAVCMTDLCSCTAYFVDPVTQTNVNCSHGVGKCYRQKAAYAKLKLMSSPGKVDVVDPRNTLNCNQEGKYLPKQCIDSMGKTCHCVDQMGNIVSDSVNDNGKCDPMIIDKVKVTLTFVNQFNKFLARLEEFKSFLQGQLAGILKVSNSAIQIVDVVEGSTIVILEVSQIDDEVAAKIDTLQQDIMSGNVNMNFTEPLVFNNQKPIQMEYVYAPLEATTTTSTTTTTIPTSTSTVPTTTTTTVPASPTTSTSPTSTTASSSSIPSSTTTTANASTPIASTTSTPVAATGTSSAAGPTTTVKSEDMSTTDRNIIIVAGVLLGVFFLFMIAIICCSRIKKNKQPEKSKQKMVFTNPGYERMASTNSGGNQSYGLPSNSEKKIPPPATFTVEHTSSNGIQQHKNGKLPPSVNSNGKLPPTSGNSNSNLKQEGNHLQQLGVQSNIEAPPYSSYEPPGPPMLAQSPPHYNESPIQAPYGQVQHQPHQQPQGGGSPSGGDIVVNGVSYA